MGLNLTDAEREQLKHLDRVAYIESKLLKAYDDYNADRISQAQFEIQLKTWNALWYAANQTWKDYRIPEREHTERILAQAEAYHASTR